MRHSCRYGAVQTLRILAQPPPHTESGTYGLGTEPAERWRIPSGVGLPAPMNQIVCSVVASHGLTPPERRFATFILECHIQVIYVGRRFRGIAPS